MSAELIRILRQVHEDVLEQWNIEEMIVSKEQVKPQVCFLVAFLFSRLKKNFTSIGGE